MFDPKLWPDMFWLILAAMFLIGYLVAGLFALIESVIITWVRARYGLPAVAAASDPDDDEPAESGEVPEPGQAKQDTTLAGPDSGHGAGAPR